MWSCRKCGKPVFFAERKQSLGYDWHPECLRCDECGKRLNPGQHAEHKGVPYCHVPCYSALFGPTLFGHGSQVESHTSFGKVEKRLPPGIDKSVLESKLKVYNQYYEGNSSQLKWKERNGKLILEGVLRIYWGVNNLIHLKENEDQRHHVQIRKRNSCRGAILYDQDDSSDDDTSIVSHNDTVKKYLTLPVRSHKKNLHKNGDIKTNSSAIKSLVAVPDLAGELNELKSDEPLERMSSREYTDNVGDEGEQPSITPMPTVVVTDDNNGIGVNENNFNEINSTSDDTVEHHEKIPSSSLLNTEYGDSMDDEDYGHVVFRPKREKVDLSRVQIRKLSSSRSKTKLKRRCSINGHFYNRETKTFKPPHGSGTNVWVTSMVNTHEVINLLLEKFCVENSPEEFALYIVRDNGEVRRVKENEYPLLVRVMLGPHDDVAKVFIMDRKKTDEISNEVAQYLNFQEPELTAILRKFCEEEEREAKKIKLKYNEMKRIIKARLSILMTASKQQMSAR